MSRGTPHRAARVRAGFTLVEMLVTLTIILILAAFAIAFVPRFQENSRAARGADLLQGWLLNAKMMAKREGHPVGVRLNVPQLTTTGNQPVVTLGAVAATAPQSSTVSVTATSGSLGNGVLWQIQPPLGTTPGSTILIADASGLNAEVVTVTAVNGNSISAPFTQSHQAGASVRLLGYVTNLQYIEQPDDLVVTPGVANSGFSVRRVYPYQNNNVFNTLTGSSVSGGVILEPSPNLTPPLPPDFSGGFWQSQQIPGTADQYPVQAGDYLELNGGGQVHMILGVIPYTITNTSVAFGQPPTQYVVPINQAAGFPNAVSLGNANLPNQQYLGVLVLQSQPAEGATAGAGGMPTTLPNPIAQYRIIRSPRVLKGEQDLQMPQSVVIDLGTNYLFNNPMPVDAWPAGQQPPAGLGQQAGRLGTIDILFSPSGALLGRAQSSSSVILWVRDVTQGDNAPHAANDPANPIYMGEPTLISVYSRTGFIAAHPVDISGTASYPNPPPQGWDPYNFAKNPNSSGL